MQPKIRNPAKLGAVENPEGEAHRTSKLIHLRKHQCHQKYQVAVLLARRVDTSNARSGSANQAATPPSSNSVLRWHGTPMARRCYMTECHVGNTYYHVAKGMRPRNTHTGCRVYHNGPADIQEQRREEGHGYPVFRTFRSGALALQTAEGQDQPQLMRALHAQTRAAVRLALEPQGHARGWDS